MSSFGGFGQAATTADAAPVEACTPWMAASDGNLELVQKSLSALQLQPNAADQNGYTLVHAAAAYNQQNVLEWLLAQQGVSPNAQDNDGDSPLHHVEHVEAARFLMERMQVNPLLLNAENKTALQARKEELTEQMDDEEEETEDELKSLVEYLTGVTNWSVW